MMPPTKSCLHCGSTITKLPRHSMKTWETRVKFCSRVCTYAFIKDDPEWRRKQSLAHKGKTRGPHSEETKEKIRRTLTRLAPSVCETCGKKVTRGYKRCKRHRIFTESMRRNIGNANRGEKSQWWKGGITPINKHIRNSVRYLQWRKTVMERDDYTCVLCGKRGGDLEADHIKPFAYYPDLRFDITNGRTLCEPCHKETETYALKLKEAA